MAGTDTNGAAAGKVYLVSRHPGTARWLRRTGLRPHRIVETLCELRLAPGDRVVGNLPAHLAARVCAVGARYLHVAFDRPTRLRGRELSATDLERLGARLEELVVRHASVPARRHGGGHTTDHR